MDNSVKNRMKLNDYLIAIDETYDKMNVSYKNKDKQMFEHWLDQLCKLGMKATVHHDLTFEELCRLTNGGYRLIELN